ncbi:MAG: hypothetical protein ACREJ9_16410 [Candidatus Rokuibacteriota bacterium]
MERAAAARLRARCALGWTEEGGQRRTALLETMWTLAPRDLRDLIALDVHCALLARKSVVEVDMGGCGRDEIWEALSRWSAGLPPGGRLLVNGRMSRDRVGCFRIETVFGPALSDPPQARPA